MSQIEIKNLSYIYSYGTCMEKKAINNVSVNMNKGEFIGLIGRTGSGKSTFIKQLNGLLKPSKGTILLDGENIWKEPKKIRDVRFKVGLVFQYPEHQLFEETVYKDIAFGPTNMGLYSQEINERVYDAICFVGLSQELLNKSPFELSGGEKRRVAIAGVIAMDPEVLILDEPTAGLDPQGREQLLTQINKYHKEKGKTVILVSHNMEDIASFADKVMVLNDGKLVKFGTTKSVFSNPNELEQIGLQVPQITRIMSCLKDEVPEMGDGILTVDEGIKEILKVISKRRNINA